MSSLSPILIFLLTFLLKDSIAGSNFDLERERSYKTPVRDSPLLPNLLESLSVQKHSPDTSDDIHVEYDFIVVGGGAGGSVVASRLSEVPCVSVILLEAGPAPPRLTDIVAFNENFFSTDIDWEYETIPQMHTGRGQINSKLILPSGKCLGGSTSHNTGVYVRGNKKDYDDWAKAGAKGWSYQEVLPYFIKAEDNQNYKYGSHGVGGPITVEKPRYTSELKQPILEAIKSFGYPVVDPNSGNQTGFYDFQSNLRHSQRCSTAKGYLVPAENRSNLDILPNAFVRKVVIENGHAVGVLFDYYGQTYQVNARREVILSAGGIKTPQILMLSGIGPEKHLRKFKIPVQANLPVGMNFQDHVEMFLHAVLKPQFRVLTANLGNEAYIREYMLTRSGPLATVAGTSYVAFLLNDEVNPVTDFPNYELYINENVVKGPAQYWNLKPKVYQQVYGPYLNASILSCNSQILHPKSRGRIQLKSSNPYDKPVIDGNYLADSRDIDDIVAGLKTCKRIFDRLQLMQVIVETFQTLYPGCEKFSDDEDSYFRCVLRSAVFTTFHFCCSAKMGDVKDPTTVVDPELKVKNIIGLRVVDTSVMPQITSGNTETPTIMIAEKAADMIKKTIKCGKVKCHQQNSAGSKSTAES